MIGFIYYLRRAWRFTWRAILCLAVLFCLWIMLYRWVNPPTTFYMVQQRFELGQSIQQNWVDFEDMAPVAIHAVVAAEDADYCLHWGIDTQAVRRALAEGAVRGGSTISQQTVKNVFLWQGRNWLRKSVEMLLTPIAELFWGKRRLLEIYMNMIEFDTGVFGIEAAAQHHFGIDAAGINRVQAGRLASVLPDPKGRSAVNPSPKLRNRAAQVIAGSDMILRDGRADCFID